MLDFQVSTGEGGSREALSCAQGNSPRGSSCHSPDCTLKAWAFSRCLTLFPELLSHFYLGRLAPFPLPTQRPNPLLPLTRDFRPPVLSPNSIHPSAVEKRGAGDGYCGQWPVPALTSSPTHQNGGSRLSYWERCHLFTGAGSGGCQASKPHPTPLLAVCEGGGGPTS